MARDVLLLYVLRKSFILLIVVMTLSVACSTHEVDDFPDTERSCEVFKWSHTHKNNAQLDVLFVIDRTSQMAPFVDELKNSLGALGRRIEPYFPDLHIAVAGADASAFTYEAQSPNCSTPTDSYLIAEREPYFRCGNELPENCLVQNFEGALEQAIPCIGALATELDSKRSLLESTVQVLESAPEGFLRPSSDALLIVIVSAGDDESPRELSEYVDLLSTLPNGPRQTIVTVVAPPSATRLADFYSQIDPYLRTPLAVTEDWGREIEEFVLNGSLACIDHLR